MLHNLINILSGMLFVMGIISGIGPQSLNILDHAIKRRNYIAVATTCCLADLVLLFLACVGLNLIITPLILAFINIIGIIFMVWYILIKFMDLFKRHQKIKLSREFETRNQAILRALALTWLNPLVYIDLVVIIGGTASQYKGSDWYDFVAGAILGDVVWIYGITFFAKSFSKQLDKALIWHAFDVLTIVIMSIILFKTVNYLNHSHLTFNAIIKS
ncbi:MAG: hypothetical protein RL017_389 [Pseudomonadota bacterium]|jgi:L-lysine exporter family protein LysE/ArgO|nr:LysE family transporter [Burkholderiales bacterium]